jgi:hypothetical protein
MKLKMQYKKDNQFPEKLRYEKNYAYNLRIGAALVGMDDLAQRLAHTDALARTALDRGLHIRGLEEHGSGLGVHPLARLKVHIEDLTVGS